MTEPIYEKYEERKNSKAFAYCDHCGFAIDSAKKAVVIANTRDIIHRDCWTEYAEEHMFDLTQPAESSLPYDCDN